MARTARGYYKSNRAISPVVEFLQAGAIVAIAVFLLGGGMVALFHWFETIDCATARNGLEFIERCEADADCRLREQDRNLKRVYIRLEIARCPKD